MDNKHRDASQGLKVADMVKSGKSQTEAIKRGRGIYECRGVGNSYLVTTDEGDVLVNAGTLADARRGKALFAKVSEHAIRYVILTQSHANQFGGLEMYKTSDNYVIAHHNYPAERKYSIALSEHYRRGSRRFFRNISGSTEDMLPTREIEPDILIDEKYSFELGGRRFETIWTPGGETRSAVVVWLPEEKVAIVGNLFGPLFGNQPNLNTLRGDKPRSALEFIASVKKVRDLQPEQLLTGHEDIRGREHIHRELGRIIDSVQWVHDKTIEGMNAGIDLKTLMRQVVPPPELTLTEEYGKVSWNVRAIWHEYTGWFDPSCGTTELYGISYLSVAPDIVELVGSADRLIARAGDLVEQGRPLEALYLIDISLAVDSTSRPAREEKKAALLKLREISGDQNLWERMWLVAALDDLD